jgi:ADP-ribosylglycohydrolase
MDKSEMPPDQAIRFDRMMQSLDGLSVGDAFGQQFFYTPEYIATRTLPVPRWKYTDDTEMAIGVSEALSQRGTINQDELAEIFAERYRGDPHRGYGGNARELLNAIGDGADWQEVSAGSFGGQGSMGNGGAMRVAPLGAYFADDLDAVVREATASAQVTHMHPEGIAGAIAVAVAAATAWQFHESNEQDATQTIWRTVLELTPSGETHKEIERARNLSHGESVHAAANLLGNGSQVISSDTVPFPLWCATRHLNDYAAALWTTVSALGDRDTTCAIVGGIVVMYAGTNAIPTEWLYSREALPPV